MWNCGRLPEDRMSINLAILNKTNRLIHTYKIQVTYGTKLWKVWRNHILYNAYMAYTCQHVESCSQGVEIEMLNWYCNGDIFLFNVKHEEKTTSSWYEPMISSVKCFWRLKNILSTISCLPIPPPQKKKLGIAVARFFYRPQYKQHLNNVIDCSNNIMRVK